MRSDEECSGFAAILLDETKDPKLERRDRRLILKQDKAKRRKPGMSNADACYDHGFE
jgi:hypothetical protein